MPTQRVTVPIYGFSREAGGALILERALAGAVGVVRAYVNPATEMAYVEYDPTRITSSDVAAVIARTGVEAGDPIPR